MTNILLYHPANYPGGGVESVSLLIAKMLAGGDYRFVVATHSLYRELIDEDQRRYISSFEESPQGVTHTDNAAKSAWLADMIDRHKIDIVMLNSAMHDDIAELRRLAPSAKFIYTIHSTPFWFESGVSEGHRHRCKVRSRSSLMEWLRYKLYVKPFALKRFEAEIRRDSVAKYRGMVDECDAIMVLCDGYKEEFIREVKIDASRVYAIENATREAVWSEEFAERGRRLLYAGRLSMVDKRVERLLEVWSELMAEFPEWGLDIVGSGADEDTLRQIADKLGLERVVWHGWAPSPDRFYAESSIVCMTSQYEGFPMVLGEAMSYGCVPIAYGVTAGVARAIGDGGVLVKPFDRAAYVKELSRMMSDEEYLKVLSHRAIEHNKLFSTEIFGAKYRAMFEGVLK